MTAPATLDVNGWREHLERTGESLRVYLDGEDVTERCFRYEFHEDHVMGVVWLFKLNADGRCYREGGYVAKEMRTGNLSVRPRTIERMLIVGCHLFALAVALVLVWTLVGGAG